VAEPEGVPPPLPQYAHNPDNISDAEVDKLAEQANKLVDKFLTDIAIAIWGLALETILLSILAGAIIGDLLWVFKGWIIKRALIPLQSVPGFKGNTDEISKRIKFSLTVKINIFAWNVICATIALIFSLLVLALVWGACNSKIVAATAYLSGNGAVCRAVNGLTSSGASISNGGASGGAGAGGSY
jgi:hypothetical protein